jgi:uncharacterized protein YdaU (DUF1376 family)
MGKLPFIMFYQMDWLRDTGGLSPLAKAAWIDILAYAWNEPQRGVYERSREAFCSQLRIDQKDLLSVLSELTTVASVTASNEKVTVMSRRMFKEDMRYKNNAIRQARFKEKRRGNASVTRKTLEEREKEKRKDVIEKKNEKEKNGETGGPAPAHPKGLALGPTSPPQDPCPTPPETAHLAETPAAPQSPAPPPRPLSDLEKKQLEAQDYIARVRAKVKAQLERERSTWEDI